MLPTTSGFKRIIYITKKKFSFKKISTSNEPTVIWEPNLMHWDKLGKDSAGLMISLAEKHLAETIITADNISKRADRMLTILIPLMTIAVSYIFSKGLSSFDNDVLWMTSAFSLIFTTISLYYTLKNFQPYTISIPGEYPDKVATSTNFDNDLKRHEKYYNVVLNQLSSYQFRIKENEKNNNYRMDNNTKALNVLLLLPISPILAYFLVALGALI